MLIVAVLLSYLEVATISEKLSSIFRPSCKVIVKYFLLQAQVPRYATC